LSLGDINCWITFPARTTPISRTRYGEAPLAEGLEASDAKRLEAARGKVLDLKISLLEGVAAMLSSGRPSGPWALWKECLCILRDGILEEEVEFLVRMDGFYYGGAFQNPSEGLWPPLGKSGRMAPYIAGGFSDVILFVGFCQKELSVGTFCQTRKALAETLVDDAEGVAAVCRGDSRLRGLSRPEREASSSCRDRRIPGTSSKGTDLLA